MAVRVQEADFDVGAELEALSKGNTRIGGLASFVGLVRERTCARAITATRSRR